MAEKLFDSVWLRPPRKRSGSPALSREQIVRTAVEMLDAEGLAGLSMRRLGTRLGAGATSLYWHVAHKDELLELAVDEVMGEVYVPEAGDTPWRVGFTLIAQQMRRMLLRHPWVMGLLGSRPTFGPNAMRIGERTIAMLTAAGFDGIELSHVSAMLNAHVIGSATTQAALLEATRKAGIGVGEMVERLEPHLAELASDNPAFDRWRRENLAGMRDAECMMDDSFAFGLERMLDGLEAWLVKSAAK